QERNHATKKVEQHFQWRVVALLTFAHPCKLATEPASHRPHTARTPSRPFHGRHHRAAPSASDSSGSSAQQAPHRGQRTGRGFRPCEKGRRGGVTVGDG